MKYEIGKVYKDGDFIGIPQRVYGNTWDWLIYDPADYEFKLLQKWKIKSPQLIPGSYTKQDLPKLYRKITERRNMLSQRRTYLLENEVNYSKQERTAFLESLKGFSNFKNEIYRSKKLKEISSQLGQIIESAEAFTLKETDGWFDNISVNKDLKELKGDYKLFEKTCQEMTQLQQRLESLYENIGTKLGRYYDV